MTASEFYLLAFVKQAPGHVLLANGKLKPPKAWEKVPIIAQHIFLRQKKAERADGYQTTVTGVQGGYRQPCQLQCYLRNEKQWADQRASYDL